MDDLKYWVGFSLIPGVGRARFSLLEKHFGTLEVAWQAPGSELRAAGLDTRTIQAILARRPKIDLEAEIANLAKNQVQAIAWSDDGYPPRLREIPDPPPVLYVKGSLRPEDEWSVAVVGTRKPSIYGREVAEMLSTDLARSRVTVVSGLARGIDSVAHRAALDAGGRSIAVFACGLDRIYPPENASLARNISDQGAVVSEYPLGTLPRADYFPRRNRIMSGLSLGVLVVEAGEQSGALITVHHALEQNREGFAVPGSILSPTCRGTNRIIQDGAKLVRDVQDILEELNLTAVPQQLEMKELLPADAAESSLIRCMSTEPRHIDEIGRASGLPPAVASSTLALMELKGMVKQVGGMHYVLTRETREGYSVPARE